MTVPTVDLIYTIIFLHEQPNLFENICRNMAAFSQFSE